MDLRKAPSAGPRTPAQPGPRSPRRPRQPGFRISLLAALLLAPAAQAQEAVLNGLGWVRQNPGSTLDASTRVQVTGNRATAGVTATGGRAGAAANVAGRVELIATAQANAAGLSGVEARKASVEILRNQVLGLVNAIGGAATANTVLISGGGGRKPLVDSRFALAGNTAASVDAIGAKGSVLLGAGSLQLPGRAAANTVLVDESDLRRLRVALADNRSDRTSAFGGAALANALTAAASTLEGLQANASGNTARDVRGGGGAGGLGYGVIASADLAGVAAANATVIAGSTVRGMRVTHAGNQAENIAAVGGSALANTFNLTQYANGLSGYEVALSGNRASQVLAHGGTGSVLAGALADVSVSSTALANAVSVQGGRLGDATRHLLASNRADGVRATGGGAVANSIWLQDATSDRAPITLAGNTAQRVETAGGGGNIGGGAVGAFERNSRSVANSVVVDGGSTLSGGPATVSGNDASHLRATGGSTVASSVLVTGGGELRGVQATIAGNRASQLRATGFEAQAGGGLLGSASQLAIVLANSLAAEGSVITSGRAIFSGNTASELSAQGGKLLANSVSAESNGKGASRLAADVVVTGNTARDITTGASGMAGPGRVFSQEQRARAAANSAVLVEDTQADAASTFQVAGNTARGVAALGGTALVNALGGYRGARITGSPVTIAGNQARQVTAGGGSGQVGGAGRVRNGILVANGVYMEAQGGARLDRSPVGVAGNDAEHLHADGGRVTANALAVNGSGDVQGSSVVVASNRASEIRSEGSEGTVLGRAVLDRGVGHAAANAALVLGRLHGAAVQIAGNTARQVTAEKGLAAANSLVADGDAGTSQVQVAIALNRSSDTRAQDGHSALAASVHNGGRMTGTSVNLAGNTAGARASGGDALAASARNGRRGSVSGSQVTIAGNRASARDRARASSLDNDGSISGGQITILGNSGQASRDGVINSVINSGSFRGGQVTILGNHGEAAGGTVNSLVNRGRLAGSQVTIAGNTGTARRGGTVNSVVNKSSGSILGANIVVSGNRGTTNGDGVVNSVVNHGVLSGRVAVVGNTGSATMGGTVNSLVNHGVMAGNVVIAGNRGSAIAGGVANSVINRGVITGSVAIVGNVNAVGTGMTAGSVSNLGGAIVGGASVTGGVPALANPGYNYTLPSTGVITRSITVGPAVGLINL